MKWQRTSEPGDVFPVYASGEWEIRKADSTARSRPAWALFCGGEWVGRAFDTLRGAKEHVAYRMRADSHHWGQS